MVRTNLKGIFATYKTLRDGSRRAYYYHRATGRRLRGVPGSAVFLADYTAAEQTISKSYHDGSFNGLVRAYTLSLEFERELAASTQSEYRRMLTKAEPVFGDMPLGALEDWRVRQEFLKWRDKVAVTSGIREADHRISAISAMLTWAVHRGMLSANHLKGFKRLYRADRAEIVWLPEHIAAMLASAPIELQQALILALHTGQREGDLLRLPWSAYDGAFIRLRQGKSRRGKSKGRLIEIPCSEALRRMLDAMPRRSPLILSTKSGRAFKKRYFIELWSRASNKAGLRSVTFPDFDHPVALHFHDLRGTTVTLLSEAGCTVQQVATITGHSLQTVTKILERYLARTKGLAEQAMLNFENSSRTEFANRLKTGLAREQMATKKNERNQK